MKKLFMTLAILLIPIPALAAMLALTDNEISDISGQMGVSIVVSDVTTSISMDSFKLYDTDTGNAIELQGLTFNDGPGGSYNAMYFSNVFDNTVYPLTIDVGTVASPSSPINGRTVLMIEEPGWEQIVYVNAQHVLFAGQDLGSLSINNIQMPSFDFYLSAHGPGQGIGDTGQGISYEFDLPASIGSLNYTYNNTSISNSLTFSGIHFAQTATGAAENPASWGFSGSFQLGNLFQDQAATFDVFTISSMSPSNPLYDTLNGKTVIDLGFGQTNNSTIPAISGSIRIADVSVGGQDLGPIAIDGIKVYRLQVYLVPGATVGGAVTH
jgi:hypothetical protein